MKKIITFAVLATLCTTCAFAGTFSDDFSSGLNSTYWSISPSVQNTYTVTTTGGDIGLSKTVTTSGNQLVSVVLNLAAVGGNVSGNFSEQVDFSNAAIGPAHLDQVQLDDSFADSSLFSDVYDLEDGLNVHVYTAGLANPNGTVNNPTATTLTAGTFLISRTGSTVTGYFNGSSIFSETESSPLSYIDFRLETQGSPNTDSTSVDFDNFSLTAASVPEPTSASLLCIGALALLRRRRQELLPRTRLVPARLTQIIQKPDLTQRRRENKSNGFSFSRSSRLRG
jgi:hypothetical protein